MHLNIKPYLIVMVSVVLILVLFGCLRNLVFAKQIMTWETSNQHVLRGGIFGLFLLFVAALVPIALKGFLTAQIRAGNAELAGIRFLTQHTMGVIYGVWAVFVLGFLVALPMMIKDGFFSNM